MRFVSDFGDQAVILPLAVAVGVALMAAGWRRGAAAWALAVAGTLGAVLVGKVLAVACVHVLAIADLRSPSGHTASAAVVYGGLIALLLPEPARGLRRWVAAFVLAAIFAVVFGGTRLALHAHTPADVLAGGFLGIAGALTLARLAGPRPAGVRAAMPLAAAVAVAVLMHGTHLRAEEVIDRYSCRLVTWRTMPRLLAEPVQIVSARP
jgi:membrane-associated phospholipid phosphatase